MTTPELTVDDAIVIAAKAYAGKRDKGRPDLPYITHPMWVMSRFTDPLRQTIAILHDAVEDSDLTLEDLRAAGASEDVVAGVDSMTHRDDETDEVYWARLALNPVAVDVKDADIDHNTLPERLALLPEDKASKLVAKYERARAAIHF